MRAPAYENVLFTILPRQALGAAGNQASRYIRQPGMEFSFESYLRTSISSRSDHDRGDRDLQIPPNNQYRA